MARLGLGRTAPHRKGRLDELWDRLTAYRGRPVWNLFRTTVTAWVKMKWVFPVKMKWVFPTVIVTPAKAGVQGATAAALQPLDSRFRGNDE